MEITISRLDREFIKNFTGGYEVKTPFYEDLSIAEAFHFSVTDFVEDLVKEVEDDVVYYTELVMDLNWKTWEHIHDDDLTLYREYCTLYYKYYEYALDHFKGDDVKYFVETTD